MSTLLSTAGAPATTLIAALAGLTAGSFLNVVIHRLPRMLYRLDEDEGAPACAAAQDRAETPTLLRPRSHCPACLHPLRLRDLVPLASWLWLRGRCAHCDAPISPRYPLVELLCALLSAATAWRFGLGFAGLAALTLTWALIALAFIDLKHLLLPDAITLPLLWLGLLVNLEGLFVPLPAAVVGAVAGYGVLWLLLHAFHWATGREGLGHGDLKLLAAAGAWLGWSMLPQIALLSALGGAAAGGALAWRGRLARQTPIPYGPWLAAATWVALLWGEALNALWRGGGGA